MPDTQAPDKPVEITLGDGSVVKGANMDEAFKNLAAMKENASLAVKTMRDDLEKERLQREALSAEVERLKNPPKPTNGNEFNREHYYKLLNEDPIGAQDYVDRYRWDMDPVQVRQQFMEMRQRVDNITQQTVAASFLQMHADDFPPDPAAARTLTQRVSDLVTKSGFAFSTDTLNYAYGQLVDEGSIKPNEQQTVVQEDTANPSLSGTGSAIADTEITKAEKMSDKELEAHLRSKGMIR